MVPCATSDPLPGATSFFQSWALRLSERVDADGWSPSVSPSCVDHIVCPPVPERPDLKTTYLAHPDDQSKHNAIASHKRLKTSPNGPSEDAGQPRNPRIPIESFNPRRTRSRTLSNGSKIVKFFRLSIGSKGAKEDLPPTEGPHMAEVGQALKTTQRRKPSVFAAFQGATIDKNPSNRPYEHIYPLPRRSPEAGAERTSKKQDRPSLSKFSSSHGGTTEKADLIIQVQDIQRPMVTIVKASPSPETQAFEPGSSKTNKPRNSKGEFRRSNGIEVLYDRSKRFLKNLGHRTSSEPASDPIDSRPATEVSELLDRVESVLVNQSRNNILRTPTPENLGSSPVAYVLSIPLSHKPAISSSSSILNLMMGKPPVNTPDSPALYGGADDRRFFKVEISNPDGPTFLPSEARRIGTPPLPSEGPRGRRRGFFFDLDSPTANDNTVSDPSPSEHANDGDEANFPRAEAEPMTPRDKLLSTVKRRSAGHNDWFSVQLKMVEDVREADERFELNVPEHLLSSPLCPRSPMHQSGGKGVCVYHGSN